jgi:hypothetical protein
MAYDDWKLMTPPQFEDDELYEYCDDCDNKFFTDELHNVLIDFEPFTLCQKCKNKAETN